MQNEQKSKASKGIANSTIPNEPTLSATEMIPGLIRTSRTQDSAYEWVSGQQISLPALQFWGQ